MFKFCLCKIHYFHWNFEYKLKRFFIILKVLTKTKTVEKIVRLT